MSESEFVFCFICAFFILAHAIGEQCNRILIFMVYTLPALLAMRNNQ